MEVKSAAPVQERSKMRSFYRRSDSAIYTGVRCPYLNADNKIEMPVRGSPVSVGELWYWMEQDFPGTFAAETLTNEAFAFWTQDEDPNKIDDAEMHKERILGGLNYAISLGFSLTVYYDESKDLAPSTDGKMPAIKFDIFPPVHDKYGVSKWDLDENNNPTKFYIEYGDAQGKKLEVDASRCTLIIWNRTTPDWRGLGILVGCKDDVRDYWYWRRVLGERAGTRAVTRYVWNKLTGGTWTPGEETSVDEAMEGIPHALVSNVQVTPIGGDLSDGEIVAILSALRQAIAMKIGVLTSDLEAAEAGEGLKFSTRLARTLRKRQNWARQYVEEIYKRMGWKFTGFNAPWEIPPDVMDKSALAISDAMENSTDKDVKELLKGRLLAIYKGVKKEKLNEIAPKEDPLNPGGFGGGNGPTVTASGGNARDNGSPADRARDRSSLNRTRQANDAPSR